MLKRSPRSRSRCSGPPHGWVRRHPAAICTAACSSSPTDSPCWRRCATTIGCWCWPGRTRMSARSCSNSALTAPPSRRSSDPVRSTKPLDSHTAWCLPDAAAFEARPPMRWAVLLAGGTGTRFWPLSSPSNPKQLLPLAGERSTAEDALARLEGFIPAERVLIVTGPLLAPRLQAALGLPDEYMLVEPRPASTAPALIWASFEALRRDPDAEVLSMHADWAIGNAEAFRRAAESALACARQHDRLVTVGMEPNRPETGFGYIVRGAQLSNDAWNVARFSEKPDAATALDLMAAGALWNSGLFGWTAERLLAEVRQHTPEVAPYLPLLESGDVARFFESVTPISIDVGVLERSRRIAVV